MIQEREGFSLLYVLMSEDECTRFEITPLSLLINSLGALIQLIWRVDFFGMIFLNQKPITPKKEISSFLIREGRSLDDKLIRFTRRSNSTKYINSQIHLFDCESTK